MNELIILIRSGGGFFFRFVLCILCFFLFVLLLFLSTHLTKEFHVTNTMIHMAETNSCGHKYILLTDD